jgi:hypothetical protein
MPVEVLEDEDIAENTGTAESRKQDIFGRLSLASYSFLKNPESEGRQHMRYAFSLAARNIAGSRLSFENYMTFSHTLDQWDGRPGLSKIRSTTMTTSWPAFQKTKPTSFGFGCAPGISR